MERKIYNPIQKDSVVFLKTAAETNDECTLVEVELVCRRSIFEFILHALAKKARTKTSSIQDRSSPTTSANLRSSTMAATSSTMMAK